VEESMTKDEGCKYGEDIGDDCILGVDGGGIFASWRCYKLGSVVGPRRILVITKPSFQPLRNCDLALQCSSETL
jgi:hypothetical protein